MYYKELSVKVKLIKENKGEENTMIDLIEEYADKRAPKAAKQAAFQQKVDFAVRCLRKGYTEEVTADLAELPLDDVQKLAEKRTA